MTKKEPQARVKIDALLKESGWRLLDDKEGKAKANVGFEVNVKARPQDIEKLGSDFEKQGGRADYVLYDNQNSPVAVLEAKSESKSPLEGKEQARAYARSLSNTRFIILSNGESHYLWDLEKGDPVIISKFPTQQSLHYRQEFKPNKQALAREQVDKDYLKTQQSHKPLRDYQLNAIKALQAAAGNGSERFLFEMATGTGKTITSAAVIKLFLKTGNAKRVLFLVDRIELEDQAKKSFTETLSRQVVIYKENRDDWHKADVVISTVQSLVNQQAYRSLFSPTDFDLLIADECHRAIGGKARAVFEYFIGYKLGLTATPKDYLKNTDTVEEGKITTREMERRTMLDTYKTFGCHNGEPTFKYGLTEGVKGGYLLSPKAINCQTGITTQMLSDKGYAVPPQNITEEAVEESEGLVHDIFYRSDFEKKFYSENTNKAFCNALVNQAQEDPISSEMGKTLVFCVSQSHATKITQILNKIATKQWGNKYNSDFAVQVTSSIKGSADMARNFANNRLNGESNFLNGYKTSKTRVCVTVGMMTTGYDCTDVLNIALMRPIFSPTDFVQMKGRGTRKHTFSHRDEHKQDHKAQKQEFHLLDFFANCEFFEKDFNYSEVLKLPKDSETTREQLVEPPQKETDEYISTIPDYVKTVKTTIIGKEGMKVDRELFARARQTLTADKELADAVKMGQQALATRIFREKYEDKPELHLNMEKVRVAEGLDRPLGILEFLRRVFKKPPFNEPPDKFKSREELNEERCKEYILIHQKEGEKVPYIKEFIMNYLGDDEFKQIIRTGKLANLSVYPGFGMDDLEKIKGCYKNIVAYLEQNPEPQPY